MSIFVLKIIAMISMFCDHLAYSIINNPLWMRCIGRFAFPLYAFLLVEGFRHMKDNKPKLEKHLAWLVVLALITEPFYDILECSEFSVKAFASDQSAIFTLLIGFLGLIAINKWKDKPLYVIATIIFTTILSYVSNVNYKFTGILLIYAFYFYSLRMENLNYLQRLLFLLGIFILYIPLYHWTNKSFCDFNTYIETITYNRKWWYGTHIGIAFLLSFYKGQKGPNPKPFSIMYRYFYPAHICVLGIIRLILIIAGIKEL